MGFGPKTKYISFKGHAYVLNLDAIKRICLTASSEGSTKEVEISQVYEPDERGELSIASKVEHETKINGNPQNDMIVYDIVKMFILSLLENDKPSDIFEWDLGTTFAINTLLHWGILEEKI